MARKPRSTRAGKQSASKRARVEEAGAHERVQAAALELAAERGWRNVSLGDIAERAGLSLADVHAVAPNRAAILTGLIADIDQQVLEGGAPDAGNSPRDRLFDLLMRRFDALSPHRDGIVALADGCRDDPLTFLCVAPRAMRSMALMLEMAGIPTGGIRGLVRVQGLAAVAAAAFRVWLHDDSQDMAKTMAALDKGLSRAENLARRLSRFPRPHRGAAETSEAA
jgi:AcrR family transcriptional regulator